MPTLRIKCLGCSSDVYAVNCKYRCHMCGFEGGWVEVTSQDGPKKERYEEQEAEAYAERSGRGSELFRRETDTVGECS